MSERILYKSPTGEKLSIPAGLGEEVLRALGWEPVAVPAPARKPATKSASKPGGKTRKKGAPVKRAQSVKKQ